MKPASPGAGQSSIAAAAAAASAAAAAAAASAATAASASRPAPNYTLDLSQADTGNYRDPLGGAEPSSSRAAEPVHAAVAHDGNQPKPAAEVFAAQHAYDPAAGIYNVARSGPYVASEFNPLIELSWKDIEDVYNYRASTLKDYARNVPSAPTKLITPLLSEHPPGTNGDKDMSELVDASILALLPSDEELKNLQHRETAVYMSDEVADVLPEIGSYTQSKEDPDATGDRLQAMVGYKPGHPQESNRLHQPPERAPGEEAAPPSPGQPFDSEGIVDLDAIDIFDNLDEWIDIDRLERGEDPFAKPAPATQSTADSQQVGGDELRELLKNRIKQSAELASDPAKPAIGGMSGGISGGIGAKSGPGAGPAAAAAPAAGAGQPEGGEGIPRPKNKFIGGRATDTPPPSPNQPFVRQIPAEIRKACMILGVRPEEMTAQSVVETWKSQIIKVHPDQGGDTEAAIFLNTAKDTIIQWLDAQGPKLGKKFAKDKG